ncbi:inosine/xanthosine triphosphatase [Candidatus Roizmanbacteria bacterium]|nr:inosine/xanthosine triphosphatase [Candidatus Roizmanbacteria bacterium]
MKTKLVAVGSTNPVKIEATKQAFEAVFPDVKWECKGVSVVSGVSDQPLSDEVAIQGAKTRAHNAREALHADFGVGLEGGLHQIEKEWFACGWMVVEDTMGTLGIGSSFRLVIAPKVMAGISEGKELGVVSDQVFEQTNIKQKGGYFGAMTNNLITRTSGYRDGVISALTRFLHPELYT